MDSTLTLSNGKNITITDETLCALYHATHYGLNKIALAEPNVPELVKAQDFGTWRNSTDPLEVKAIEEKEARIRADLFNFWNEVFS